ncbi:MAG: hypothetical protein LBQ64_02270 [Bacteroidales bacterium]|nr:hypothetical protein [Bacteroidales bacterium]
MTKKQRNKQYRLLFICLMLSVVSWFAVKMSKNYQQTYVFAVDFVNLPVHKRLVYQSDSVMSITIDAKGLSLLKYELPKKQISIDYAAVTTTEQQRRNYITLQKNQLNTYLIKQMDFPETAVINTPSSVTLEFETFSDK